jgi:hypothetical protein
MDLLSIEWRRHNLLVGNSSMSTIFLSCIVDMKIKETLVAIVFYWEIPNVENLYYRTLVKICNFNHKWNYSLA